MILDAMLDDRRSRYGDFASLSRLSQRMKEPMRLHEGWSRMDSYQREALEMILHKVARIVNGDPNYDDSWTDIIGYTQRVIEQLKMERDI